MDHSKNDRRFCVYTHSIDGSVVYIGSGVLNRVNSKSGRTKEHVRLWSKLKKEVIIYNLSKTESLELEKIIYNSCKINNDLLNKIQPLTVKNVTFDYMSKFLKYDEDSPTFLTWVVDRGKSFQKGTPAGGKGSNGYFSVKLNNVSYKTHRIIYCLANKTDVPPNLVIDHKDGDRGNNHISNLRLVTSKVNSLNKMLGNYNTSGTVGVSWDSNCARWKSFWMYNGKLKSKTFNPTVIYPDLPPEEAKQKAFEDAVAYRKQMEELYYK